MQKIPKKILTKFSYPKESWNQNFQTPKNPLIIPALEIWSTPSLKFGGPPPPPPWGPTSIIILFLTIPISIRRKCYGSRKTAWIFHQILSTNSLRKCQEINVENLCINIRVFRVEMDIDGTGNIVSALNRGWRHWDSDRRMVEPTFRVQVNYCKTSLFTDLSVNRKLAFIILIYKLVICMYFCFIFFILLKICWFKGHAGLFLCGNKILLHSFFYYPWKALSGMVNTILYLHFTKRICQRYWNILLCCWLTVSYFCVLF